MQCAPTKAIVQRLYFKMKRARKVLRRGALHAPGCCFLLLPRAQKNGESCDPPFLIVLLRPTD